jgi:uncharacterized membrane protein (GlpM family)
MSTDKVIPVLLSIVIIVLVAVVQEKSRTLAAIIATMPLTAPLAMWVVFSSTNGDHIKTSEFVGSMVSGVLATFMFIVACWLALRQRWPLPIVLLAGGAAWLAFALTAPLFINFFRR